MQLNTTDLTLWCARVLRACGLPADDAATAAGLLVRSDARGYGTHGLARLPSYVERLAAGDFNPRPHLAHRAFAGGIVLDADGAMGHVAAPHAIALGWRALEEVATVLVVIRNCGHLGALGIHALQAAEAGALCVLGQSTPPLLAMGGFSGPAIGHNPLAFGCPLPGQPPLVFDMACSVAARGHILAAAREQRPIPDDWAVDAEGRPTTDPEAALAGALLPSGGHKGIGIAMLVQCLASGLAATAQSVAATQAPVPTAGAVGGQSAFLWLVRPTDFAAAPDFARHMQDWTSHYLARGGEGARLPGARGAVLEARSQTAGLTVEGALLRDLTQLGERLALPFPRARTETATA
jgi:LDH2 family malate/lactate/ureidoglycolate dehydrogenase